MLLHKCMWVYVSTHMHIQVFTLMHVLGVESIYMAHNALWTVSQCPRGCVHLNGFQSFFPLTVMYSFRSYPLTILYKCVTRPHSTIYMHMYVCMHTYVCMHVYRHVHQMYTRITPVFYNMDVNTCKCIAQAYTFTYTKNT